jgi:hypothetical protein
MLSVGKFASGLVCFSLLTNTKMASGLWSAKTTAVAAPFALNILYLPGWLDTLMYLDNTVMRTHPASGRIH